MNMFKAFESRIANAFGVSPQGARPPFSFRKLARRAVKEMEEETFIIDGIDTAPALFTILVSGEDDALMRPLYAELTEEIDALVEASAAQKGYVFVGKPLARFMVDPSLRRGRFAVFANNVDAHSLEQLRREEQEFLSGANMVGGAASAAVAPSHAAHTIYSAPEPEPEPIFEPEPEPAQAEPAAAAAPAHAAPAHASAPAHAAPAPEPEPVPVAIPPAGIMPVVTPEAGVMPVVTSGAAPVPVAVGATPVPVISTEGGSPVASDVAPAPVAEPAVAAAEPAPVGAHAAPIGAHAAPIGAHAAPPAVETPNAASAQVASSVPISEDSMGLSVMPEEFADAMDIPVTPEPGAVAPIPEAAAIPVISDVATPQVETPATIRREPAAPAPTPASAAAAPEAATCLLIDRQSGQTYTATAPSTTIGRERTAKSIVLRDPNVSRRHAELTFDGASWRITDLNSTNGTLVNDVDVDSCALRDGDLITLGLMNLEFRVN